MDFADFLLDGADRVLRIVVPRPLRPLPPANQRLMDALGVVVVVGSDDRVSVTSRQARGARPMGQYVTVSSGRVSSEEKGAVVELSAEERRALEQERQDAQPMTAGCAVEGCGWSHEGTVGECRNLARAHRESEHPLLVSQSFTERKRAEQAEASAAARRQRAALEAMDDGEPQPVDGEETDRELMEATEPDPIEEPLEDAADAPASDPPAAAADSPGKWSRKRVEPAEAVDLLRAGIAEIGHVPTMEEWRRSHRRPSVNTFLRIFKSWTASLEAAGHALPEGRTNSPPRHSPPQAWTRESIVEAVQRWAREHGGEPPMVHDWTLGDESYPSPTTVKRRFGKWGHAVVAAGFPRPLVGGVLRRPGKGHAEGHSEGTELAEIAADAAGGAEPEPAAEDTEEDTAEVVDEPEDPTAKLAGTLVRLVSDRDVMEEILSEDADGWIERLEGEAERLLAESDRLVRRARGVETVVEGLRILRETA